MNYFKKLSAVVCGLLLILAMGACTPTVEPGAESVPEEPTAQPEKPAEKVDEPADTAADTVELDGTLWDLLLMGDVETSRSGISVQFGDGTISGSDGCNWYSSGYKLENGILIIEGPFISTMMACPDVDMELGSNYLQALESAGAVSIVDGALTIQTDRGELVFRAPESAGIEDTKWVLNSTRTELGVFSMAIDQNIFFRISNGEINGDGGCNGFGGNVAIDGLQISFGELVSTEMFCEGDGVSEREAEFFEVLNNAKSYETLRNALTLFDEDGEVIATFRAAEDSP